MLTNLIFAIAVKIYYLIMSNARDVWMEDGVETEGVVPCNWIINIKLYWPNGVSVIRHFQLLI